MIKRYLAEKIIEIEQFNEKNLLPTFYYFSLGDCVGIWNENLNSYKYQRYENANNLIIPARGYVLIKSLERFSLSNKVLGLFSQISSLPQAGIRLNHSLSVDPGFKGRLEMGLENVLNKDAVIPIGSAIGKIVFFDVTDTYPIENIDERVIMREKLKRRENLDKPEEIELREEYRKMFTD
jgi:deoxycytidine triphosphate deaminase